MKKQDYKKYFYVIAPELKQTEHIILQELHTEVPQLQEAAAHLITSGGKRLRPAFLLLAGKLFRENIDFMLPMAAAMEIAHVGTLVHDDVVDASDFRRGVETVRARYGEAVSLCAGDFLFARSLQLASDFGDDRILKRLTEGCCAICAGEIEQLQEAFSPAQTVRSYLRRIRKKTALLISLSCETGAMQCGANETEIRALRNFGNNLGMAFQISDDILDFTADEKVLGKPVGSDVRNGLMTFPLLYAMQDPETEKLVREQFAAGRLEEEAAEKIIEKVKYSGGIDAAVQLAERYATKAVQDLEIFPPSAAKESLRCIARQVARRNF